jgi:hypothetical protein
MLRDEDRRMLEEIFAEVEDDETEIRFNAPVLRSWLERGWPLKPKQLAWLKDVHEKVCGTFHEHDNSKVPRGREVPSMGTLGPFYLCADCSSTYAGKSFSGAPTATLIRLAKKYLTRFQDTL